MGRWNRFKAATAQVDVVRQQDSTRVYIQINPIRKEIYFESGATAALSKYCHIVLLPHHLMYELDTEGIIIFKDSMQLSDIPLIEDGDDRPLLADYSPARIVFTIQPRVSTENPHVFGLVSCFFPYLLVLR